MVRNRTFGGSGRSCGGMVGTLDQICQTLLGGTPELEPPQTHHWHPPTDVFECDEVYVIRVSISGLRHTPTGEIQDAEVVVEDDTVIIRGARSEHCPHTKRAFYQMEINYGPFERRVRFTAPFDRDNVRAQYHDGFLEVIVPKAVRLQGKPHRIRVQS